MVNRLLPPVLTRRRIWLAYGISVVADGIQLLLGPIGWAGVDEAIDVVAMALLTLAIGFHPLFIPTFVTEFLPIVDMLPTWTGCTALVIAMRRKQKASATPPPHPPPVPGKVIDI